MVTIGQQFAEERRAKGLTLAEVSRSTKIREEFLRAIERGDFKALPGSSYAYGFVRNYAKFLGLPVEKSLALFRREYDVKKNVEILPRGFTNPKEYSIKKIKLGRTSLLIGVVAILVLIFLFYQYRAAVFNPDLSVSVPTEGAKVSSSIVQVEGKTDGDTTLTVDNIPVSVDDHGNFTKEITLFPGNVTITLKAENRFGKVTTLERHINVKTSY